MKMKRLFSLIVISLFVLQGLHAQTPQISRNERWREDVSFYAEQLPQRHKNLFFHLSKEEFTRDVKQLERGIPALEDNQIKLRLMILTAKINDGHTNIGFDKIENIELFPLKLRQFPEGWFVVEALPAYKQTVGKRLVKIGNVSTEEAARRVADVFAVENKYGAKDTAAILITSPFLLKAKEIIESETEADFTFADKEKELTLNIKPEKYLDIEKAKRDTLFDDAQLPLALKNSDKNYWFEYLPGEKTLYLAFNRCQQDKAKPFAEFAKEVFAVVDKSEVEKFVVDVRRNAGGNSAIIFPLYDELKKRPRLTQKGKFFVLMSGKTFSSGFLNSIEMRRKFGALWIGEPSSQRPVGYGEVKTFELPHSKILVQYSTKKYVYDEKERRDFMPVDIAIEETFADYSNGRHDKVLGVVFNYRRK